MQDPGLEGITYSEWIQGRLYVDYGMPLTFEGRPYLRKIHDLGEPKILLRTGRQVEKSSSLAAKLVTQSCLHTAFKSLYVSPSQGQTRVFSHMRLDRVLMSPYVRAKFFDPLRCADQVYEKGFLNGSTVHLSYASTDADRCRGITADFLLCLAGSSEILLGNGRTARLEDLVDDRAVGTELVAYSERTRGFVTSAITALHVNGRRAVGRLRVETGQSIVCTPDHRFLTEFGVWQTAERLGAIAPNDLRHKRIALGPGRGQAWALVVGWEEAGEEDVYDLTMSNDHSFVANGIVVHNCDEIQDMTADVFPVLEETQSHSEHGLRVYAGTPKTLNNAMETHWKHSTQCEWTVHCLHCSKWIYQDTKIIQEAGPTCPECGKLLDPQYGRWEPRGAENAEFMGFRIPQTMVPWIAKKPAKWKDLYEKFKKWPTQQFYNEVLGLAHEKGANPLTEGDLKGVCDPEKTITGYRHPTRYFDALFAGVDWGHGLGSFTVLTISGWHNGKGHVEYMYKFASEKDEPEAQVQEIARTVQRFGVGLVGCDWGGGFAQNKALALALTGTADVIQFYASGVKKRDISYQRESRLYTFNRSMGMSMLIQAILRKEVVLPRWEDFAPFAEDFTCIFEDYNTALRMIVYDHPEDIPDDSFHSMMFAFLTMKIGRGNLAV